MNSNKKRYILYPLMVVSIFLQLQCSDKASTPSSSGGISEVLVVSDHPIAEKQFHDSILSLLSAPVPGIYPEEPRFDLIFVPWSSFSEILHRHHSILIASVNDTVPKFSATTTNHYWSSPQTVITLQASHPDSLMAGLRRFSSRIIKVFSEARQQRILRNISAEVSAENAAAVKEISGLDMAIPASFTLVSREKDRQWYRSFSGESEQSLSFFSSLRPGSEEISAGMYAALIDSLGSIYLKGGSDSSRFGVSADFPVFFQVQKTWLKTVYVCRGWWRMSHDMMGGPFLSYLYRRNDKDGWLMILGYIYHPNLPKRDRLLELEAIVEEALYKKQAG